MATNYNTTSHSKYLLQCHLVFSTKYRKKILTGVLSEDSPETIKKYIDTQG